MDPITLVITAVVLGASAGLQDAAAQVVKDSYAGLRTLLTRRQVDLAGVERQPESRIKQASLREDLEQLKGGPDAVDGELVAAARQMIDAVKAHDPQAGAAIGIDLEEFQANSLKINDLTSEGTGVRGRNWTIAGDAVFENIRAGHDSSTNVGSDDTTRTGGNRPPQ